MPGHIISMSSGSILRQVLWVHVISREEMFIDGAAIVDYSKFSYNFDTMCGRAAKLGPHPRYRVYDDIFVNRLIRG